MRLLAILLALLASSGLANTQERSLRLDGKTYFIDFPLEYEFSSRDNDDGLDILHFYRGAKSSEDRSGIHIAWQDPIGRTVSDIQSVVGKRRTRTHDGVTHQHFTESRPNGVYITTGSAIRDGKIVFHSVEIVKSYGCGDHCMLMFVVNCAGCDPEPLNQIGQNVAAQFSRNRELASAD